jgi:hypothetical protein
MERYPQEVSQIEIIQAQKRNQQKSKKAWPT